MFLNLERTGSPRRGAGSTSQPKNSELTMRCTKKHRFDPPRVHACAASDILGLRGLPLGRTGTGINSSGRLRSHRIKLHAGCERRRCDRNSLQKVPQSGCARVRIISPNVSEPSQRELMGRRSKAQTVGGVEGNTSCSELREYNARRAPLCRGWAGNSRTEYLTVEISVSRTGRTLPIQPKAKFIRQQALAEKSESPIVVRAREIRVHSGRSGEGADRSKQLRNWSET